MPAYRGPAEADADEVRLPTQPECVVRLRRHVTRGDVFDAEEYVLNTQRAGNEKQVGMSSNYRVALLQALTLALIVDWNLEDETGERWPYDFASLRRLHALDGTHLEAEVSRRMDGPGLPFATDSARPSRDTTATTPTSAEPSSSTTGLALAAGTRPPSDANGQAT